MEKNRTIIISLLGGPGIGKTTLAADVYAHLKKVGFSTELLREHVRDALWANAEQCAADQLVNTAKQIRDESFLAGKVDMIVTDAPALTQIHFCQTYAPTFAPAIKSMVRAHYDDLAYRGHEVVFVMLEREYPYDSRGRWCSEIAALDADASIQRVADAYYLQPLLTKQQLWARIVEETKRVWPPKTP